MPVEDDLQRVTIFDIGERDGYYSQRERYLGLTGRFRSYERMSEDEFESGIFFADNLRMPIIFREVRVTHFDKE